MKKARILLGLILSVGLAVLSVRGDSVVVDGVTWSFSVENGAATITRVSSYPSNLSIPAVLNGYKVTKIGTEAFYSCSSLDTVVIPNTVTEIGSGAFVYCRMLTSVVIPNSVTTIGNEAFYGCSRLADVRLPNSVTTLETYVFSECSGLKTITLPRGLKAIDEGVFNGCTSLSSLVLPDGIASIGRSAFSQCRSLQSLVLPDGIASIGPYAFSQCGALQSLAIPASVTSIGECAFYQCGSLSDLTIAGNGTSIGSYAFSGCTSLTRLTIDEGPRSIGAWAFSDCRALTTVSLPASVEQVAPSAFRGCTSLTTFVVAGGSPAYASWNGLLLSRDRTEVVLCPAGRLTAAIPATVTRIADTAFYGCAQLRSLVIPDSVQSIGAQAFYGCSGLTRMAVPLSVTAVGSQAFASCENLRDFETPSHFVLSGIVGDCARLTNLVVTAGSTNVCDSAFAGCSGLRSLTIPQGVESIGSYAFYNCRGLESVSLPTGVRTLGVYAFLNCDRLPELVLPDGMVSVGDGFVDGCSALARLSLPETLRDCGISDFTQVGRLAAGVDGLWIQDGWLLGCVGSLAGTVAVPEGVRHIASFGLYGQEEIERIDLPSSLETVGAFAFGMCLSLVEVHAPSIAVWTGLLFTEETSNPLYNGGDLYIDGRLLTDLVVPEGVTEIGDYVFSGCTTITNVVLPASVTNIAYTAFEGCPAIVSATLNSIPQSGGEVDPREWIPQGDGSWRSPAIGSTASTEMRATVAGPGQVSFRWRISPRYYYDRLRCYLDGVQKGGLGYYENGYSWVTDWQTVTLDIPAGAHTIRWVYSKEYSGSTYSGEDCGWVRPLSVFGTLAAIFPESASGLERISLGVGVQTIPGGFFAGCSSLTSVRLPTGLQEVGARAFSGCTSLARVEVPDVATWTGLHFTGTGANPTELGAELHVGGALLTDLVVPEGVTELGDYAFSGCTTVTNVVLPASLTNIAYTAFAGCSAIVSATLNGIPQSKAHFDPQGWSWQRDGSWRSPAVGSYSSAEMQAIVVGPRQISFQWRISPRYYYDRLRCYLNGVQKGGLGYYENNYSWLTDWQTVTLDIPSGAHTIRWVYSKESSGSSYSGEDCGWVKPVSSFGGLSAIFPDAADGLERVAFGAGVEVLPDRFLDDCSSLTSVRLPSTLRDCGDVDFRSLGRLAEGRPDGLWVQDGWAMGYLGTAPASVVVPEGVRHVAPHAFDGQSENLASVKLPGSLLTIGASAFYGCDGLEKLDLPDNVESIGPSAFENASWIQDLFLGSGLKRIEAAAFRGCWSIESIDCPEGLESIGASAFEDCKYALNVDIPASVTNIGVHAFAGCTNLAAVSVTTGVRTMADLFPSSVRANLRTVHVPSNETCLVAGVFSNCTALLDVDLPVGITSIPDSAFLGCQAITNVYWSGPLESVGAHAFDGCSALLECPLPPVCRVDAYAFRNCASLRSMEFPGGNDRLADYVFAGCTSLVSVDILDEVRSLGNSAFEQCSSLASVFIPAACTNLGTSCFAYCSSLREIVVPSAVTVLRDRTFYSCSSLAAVSLPEGLQTIGDWCFAVCSALAGVAYPAGLQEIGAYAFSSCRSLVDVKLPERLEAVPEGAFSSCSSLRNVSVPSTLRTLGAAAFQSCSMLTRFPFNNVRTIGSSAFQYCPFATLEIPDGVESIGEYAFANEAALREVRIPLSVTNLGTRVFYQCAVTNVTIPASLRPLHDLFRNDYYYYVGNNCVYDEYYLTRRIQSVQIVEGSPSVCAGFLQYCSGLTQISVPDSVIRIGNSAFSSCTGLKTVLLPASLSSLGSYILQGSGIETVYFLGNAPAYDADAYLGSQANLTNFVVRGTRGWDGRETSRVLPDSWPAANDSRAIAYWTPHTFDAVFRGNGGTPVETTVVQTTKLPYVLPDEDPARAGYVFAGWWTDPEDDRGARITSDMVNEFEQPLTFYAHWKTPDYHVRFNANGGAGATLSQGFLLGTSQQLAANTYTRAGWTFAGWSTASSGGAVYAPGESFVLQETAADVTLYAQWTPNAYAVTYDARGGAGEMASTDARYDVAFALPSNAFTRAGYAFAGWTTNGTDAVALADGATVSNLTAEVDGEVALGAVWTGIPYVVAFDANGGAGTMADASAVYDAVCELPRCAFTRDGHSFVGWALSAGGAVVFGDGAAVSNLTAEAGTDVRLYAVWAEDVSFVRFHANGACGTMGDESFVIGLAQSLDPCLFTRPGYAFRGWARSATGPVAYADGAVLLNPSTENGGVLDLYAVWKAGGYTVVFDANGGSGEMSDWSLVYDTAAGMPSNAFTRVGYTFAGWATELDGEVAVEEGSVVSNLTATVDGTVELFATWEANRYAVLFDANGGTGEMAPLAMTYGRPDWLPACGFSRYGYTFAGWSTNESGVVSFGNQARVENLSAEPDATVTLYAVWSDMPYAVSFRGNGGAGSMATLSCCYGVETALPSNAFARTGYRFAGWARSASGAAEFADGARIEGLATSGTVVLWATWTPVSYRISFDPNGGTGGMAEMAASYDAGLTLPACAFTRADYVFTGWATSAGGGVEHAAGGTVWNLASREGETVTLYACWRPVSCTLTLDANGGAFAAGCAPVRTVAYGGSVYLPSAASVTWRFHDFAGWSLSPDGSGRTYAPGAVYGGLYGDATLYAKWTWTYGSEPAKTVDAAGNAWYFVAGDYAGTARLVAADLRAADATIPSTAVVAGRTCTVTGVATGAFAGCASLRTLVVPDTVTDFPMEALTGCGALEDLKLPGYSAAADADGLRRFDGRALRSLKSVVVPEGYDLVCFAGCSELVSASLPSTLKSLKWHADGADGVSGESDNVFAGCWKLEKLVFNGRPPIDAWQTASSVEAGSISGFVSALLYTDSLYYPAAYAADWRKVLGNFGYGGVTGAAAAAYPVARMVKMAVAAAAAGTADLGPFVAGLAASQTVASLTGCQLAGLPRGLSWDAQTGTLSGTAREPGVYTVAVTSVRGTETATLRVDAMPEGAPALSPEYAIVYLGLEGAANANPASYVAEELPLTLAPVARAGYVFKGWTPNGGRIEAGTAGDVTFTATWEKIPSAPAGEDGTTPEAPGASDGDGGPGADAGGDAEEPFAPSLYEAARALVGDGESAPYEAAAAVYDGYLADVSGALGGTIQVKVAKGKVDRKTGVFSAKVTATAQLASGKVSFKGGVADAKGAVTQMSAGGHVLDITVGVDGLRGTLDGYAVDGARNLFMAKAAGDKAAAQAVLAVCQGAVNVVSDDLSLSVDVAAKGKVKVSGTVKGTKVSATGTLLVGERYCAVPVQIVKKAPAAFMLWMPRAGGPARAVGLQGAEIGRPGALRAGATFRMDGSALASVLPGLLAEYLPDGLAVSGGAKWTLAKAGKVVFLKGTQEVDAAKAGENPSGLKLVCKAKDGTFKGSFKAYAVQDGKIKAYTVSVTGMLVDGVGHGTATLKKPACSIPVLVR